jgi:hypothetical protein
VPVDLSERLLGIVSSANEEKRASAEKLKVAAGARSEFDAWEETKAGDLAQVVLQAVDLLKRRGPPPQTIVIGTVRGLGRWRYAEGWEIEGYDWFKLGSNGTVFAGGTQTPSKGTFSLDSFTPLEWSRQAVAASRARARTVQDSEFPASHYICAFEAGELGRVEAAREEVGRNLNEAIDKLGRFLSDLGVSVDGER